MQQAVRTLLAYPPTWIVVATTIVIEWVVFSWFSPSFLMSVLFLGVGVAAVLAWPLVFAASGNLGVLLYGVPGELKEQDVEKLEALAADLESVGSEQGVDQLRMLREKLDSLIQVLNTRLQAGELTYGRYFATAEQVYLSAVDNLSEVVVSLKSVSSIDREYIDGRLKELRGANHRDEENTKEVATLESRRDLLDKQTKKVADLTAQNEEAMTVLARTATALADTRTTKGRASVNADEAMAELEMLAKRAGKYSSASAMKS